MIFRRISMDTDLTDEEAQKFVEQFEQVHSLVSPSKVLLQKTKLDENGHLSDQQKSALDDLLSGIPLDSNQLVDAAIAASLSQTLSGEVDLIPFLHKSNDFSLTNFTPNTPITRNKTQSQTEATTRRRPPIR